MTPDAQCFVVPLRLWVSPNRAFPLLECPSKEFPSCDAATIPSPGPFCTMLKQDEPLEHALSGETSQRAACARLMPATVKPNAKTPIAQADRTRSREFPK